MFIQQEMTKSRSEEGKEVSRFYNLGLPSKNWIAMGRNAASIFMTCESDRALPSELSAEDEITFFNPKEG